MRIWSQKFINHPVQAIIAWGLLTFFAFLPLDLASAFGGWIGRNIGPRLKVSNNARREIAVVFPSLDANKIENWRTRLRKHLDLAS